jgi:hypothetical protein
MKFEKEENSIKTGNIPTSSLTVIALLAPRFEIKTTVIGIINLKLQLTSSSNYTLINVTLYIGIYAELKFYISIYQILLL